MLTTISVLLNIKPPSIEFNIQSVCFTSFDKCGNIFVLISNIQKLTFMKYDFKYNNFTYGFTIDGYSLINDDINFINNISIVKAFILYDSLRFHYCEMIHCSFR